MSAVPAETPFDRAAPALQQALGPRSVITLDDMREAIGEGRGFLWSSPRSAVFATVTQYEHSGEKIIDAGPACGDMAEIMASVPLIEAWAREVGCTQAHMTAGRRGWARAMQRFGYEEYAVILRKLLT